MEKSSAINEAAGDFSLAGNSMIMQAFEALFRNDNAGVSSLRSTIWV